MALDNVLSPITINKVEIKNRVVRTAHGTSMGYGDMSDDLIAYHEARAKGGVGLSIVEASSVHWSGPMTMHAWDDSVIPRYKILIKKVHAHGMKMFSQINHMGVHGGAPWQQPWSASENPVPNNPVMTTHAMSKDEIAEMVEAFVQAARRAVEGGMDGVEIHGAHDFLIQQFISLKHNRREDEYGGDFENRMRFYIEVLHAVRDELRDELRGAVAAAVADATANIAHTPTSVGSKGDRGAMPESVKEELAQIRAMLLASPLRGTHTPGAGAVEDDVELVPERVFESEDAAAEREQREKRLAGIIAGVFQLKKIRRLFAKEAVPPRVNV